MFGTCKHISSLHYLKKTVRRNSYLLLVNLYSINEVLQKVKKIVIELNRRDSKHKRCNAC